MQNKTYFNKKLAVIKTQLGKSRESIQDFLLEFVDSYNDKDNGLDKNSLPLFNLLNILSQGDKYLVTKWFENNTTGKIKLNSKKTGVLINYESDSLALLGGVVGNWWEYNKPLTEEKVYSITDFEKAVKSLFAKVASKNLSVNESKAIINKYLLDL